MAVSARPLNGVRRFAGVSAGWPAVALGCAFAVRLVLVWQRATPNYFPDEYIYAALGRSFGDLHGPLVRGHSAHFPALLQPLLTAPAWSFGGVATGYRLVQAVNAAAVTLAAVPAYLLARRLRLSPAACLATAGLTLVVPDALYASFVLAEPVAYPLVLAASAVGVYALARPTTRAQIAFLALAAFATSARVQFGILPVCYLVAAAAVASREGKPWNVLREQRVVLGATLLAVVGVLAAGPHRLAGYYSGTLHSHAQALSVAKALGTNGMVVLYAAGWIIVPGAALGLLLGLWKPRSRVELAFSSLVLVLGASLLLEASLFGDVTVVQERYVFYLVPFAPIAFGLYASRGWPLRNVHALLAVALIALSARLPLSGWAQTGIDSHSPFLLGVQHLELLVGGSAAGAGIVAVVAAMLAVGAIVASLRRAATAAVIGIAVLASAAAGGLAWEFDRANSQRVLHSFLPADPSWVDAAHVGRATLLTAPGGHVTPTEEQLFWNRSLDRVVVLPLAFRPDRMDEDLARVRRDGTILVGGKALRGPVVTDEYASTVVLRDARTSGSAPQFRLWIPRGVAQLQALMLGRSANGTLAAGGGIVVWPARADGRLAGWVELQVRAPSSGPLRLSIGKTTVDLAANETRSLRIPVCKQGGLWSAKFEADTAGQQVGGSSSEPRFVPDPAACR